MGLFDLFKPQPSAPTVTGILPDAAKQEIIHGRLPILKTDTIFLTAGEECHYIDKAVYEEKVVQKRYVRHNKSYSIPGFFKGTRVSLGNGQTDVVDNVQYEQNRGVLYITNKRIVFVGESKGFDRKIGDLTAVTPYANCVEIQIDSEVYRVFVPDGNVCNMALHLVRGLKP